MGNETTISIKALIDTVDPEKPEDRQPVVYEFGGGKIKKKAPLVSGIYAES